VATDFKTRTKKFALEIIRLYSGLPKKAEAAVLGHQLLRSGTSVGAHYHEAQRAKSNADFISKIEGGLQELEETGYWLELLEEAGFGPAEKITGLRQETNELIGIFVAIVNKTKSRADSPKS
jgi:four helix bundle protein